MRSTAFTLFLLLTAILTCGIVAWRVSEGNLDAIFGVPPTPVGQSLYSFHLDEVEKISISTSGAEAEFVKTPAGWMDTRPPGDRMNPRAAIAIISVTLGLRVEDHAPAGEVDLEKTGFRENAVRIHLQSSDGRSLARYRLGGRTPWFAEDGENPQPIPTVFIQPRESGRKNHIYTCAGSLDIFQDNLKHLRDPHPFHFDPRLLHKIRIRGAGGNLTLSHDQPQAPWRITQPLDLPTDRDAVVKSLIGGLYELAAVTVLDRSAVTLPAEGSTKTLQIALQHFGSETETLLDIFPPESPEARETLAVVSDRPQTVFSLPVKPGPGSISLADLPLTVNELRDPTLTHLNIAALKEIAILPSTGSPILISRDPPQPWMASIGGVTRQANEERLAALLRAVTTTRATGFETDAATDLSPWSLDRPILKLSFLSRDEQTLELAFGMDVRGNIFVNRTGTSTVMRVDPSILSSIAVQPHEWRYARLLSVSKVDLQSIHVTRPPAPPLRLAYNFIREDWQAAREDQDLTHDIDPVKADSLLGALEQLDVRQWLAPDDPEALAALAEPTLVISVTEDEIDDFGDKTGEITRTLELSPSPGPPNTAPSYGRLSGEPNLFLLDPAIYQILSRSLFDSH